MITKPADNKSPGHMPISKQRVCEERLLHRLRIAGLCRFEKARALLRHRTLHVRWHDMVLSRVVHQAHPRSNFAANTLFFLRKDAPLRCIIGLLAADLSFLRIA